jgi:hypothetical protein
MNNKNIKIKKPTKGIKYSFNELKKELKDLSPEEVITKLGKPNNSFRFSISVFFFEYYKIIKDQYTNKRKDLTVTFTNNKVSNLSY